jgi:hypothetical protein
MKFKLDDRFENLKIKFRTKYDPAVVRRMRELELEKQRQVELANKDVR